MVSLEKKPRNIIFDDNTPNHTENIDELNLSDPNHKWETLKLKEQLMKGIYSVGFETPSFIQKKAIPIIAEGKDLRAQAQSGTGKTGAFVIGTLQRIDENLKQTQVLVLASTREIAAQNAAKFSEIGNYMNVSVCLLAGGTSVQADINLLSANPQIIVGTPGRINHMIQAGMLKTSALKVFILDEADEMLKEGFEEQVRHIYTEIKSEKFQTLLFSATYSESDLEIIEKIVSNPVEIDLRYEDQTLKGIKQYFVDIGPSMAKGASPAAREQELALKIHTLMDICKNQVLSQVMIFVNKKSHAQLAHKTLNENGFPCELISSDFDQNERKKTLQDFKSGKTRILVSSGLCKRGIDVQALSVVVCLDVPRLEEKNDFIHRIGRSGRYGRKGIALHILTSNELEILKMISDHFNSIISPLSSNFSFQN